MPATPRCPTCGVPLQAVDQGDGHTPPWGCQACARGFWTAELTAAARLDWDPLLRAPNHRSAEARERAIRRERDEAVQARKK